MGLRAKVFFGVVLFVVIFGFRFLCVSCQQVVADVVVKDHIQPQAWHQPDPTEMALNSEITVATSYQNPTQKWSANQNGRRRRRPGGRKRRRRPQGNNQTTEFVEFNNYYWEGQVQDDALNDSVILSFYNSSDYYSSTETASEESQETIKRNFIQPKQRTERVREPLAALEQEQRLSELRNKQRRRMTTEASTSLTGSYRDKSYRKPYSQTKRQDDVISQSPPRSASELKDILKNSGGLSLSEILQQNNLSLDDLIKGKQNALLALQTPTTPTTDPTSRYVKPIRRIPISYLTSTTTTSTESSVSRSWQHSAEASSTEKLPNTIQEVDQNITSENLIQDNDFATSVSLKYFSISSQLPTRSSVDKQKFTSAVTEVYSAAQEKHTPTEEVVQDTQSTLDTLPTRPSYRKRLTIKPIFKLLSTTKKPKESSSSSESTSEEKHYNKSFHAKSSSSSQESLEDRLLHKEPETNLIEKFATFEEAKPKDVATIEELFRPLYQKKDNSNLFETITSRVDIIAEKHFGLTHPGTTESNPASFTDVDTTQDVDDRTDLLELLEDRRSGNRLIKVLAQRNMTLDELIKHRQRGSSQLHLSEIVQNKTGTSSKAFSIKPQVLDEKLDIVTAFDNFPHFNLGNLKSVNPDEIKTDSQGSSYFTSIIDIKPTDDMLKAGRAMKSLTFEPADPTTFVASGEDKSIDFYAQPWKSFAVPISYTSQEANNYIDQAGEASAQISQSDDIDIVDKLDTVAQIEDEVARAHDILDLELTGHGLRRSPIMRPGEIPLGVKSAVTASSLIVVFSLTIFLMIFIVCRWKQRRRKKLNYLDNYNTMKKTHLPIISSQSTMKRIEPPMLAATTAASGNLMVFPGVKNNKINTMDPNSPEVQEYLFDAIRKPF